MRRVFFFVVLLIVHGTLYPWDFHPRTLASNAVVVLLRSWTSSPANLITVGDVAVNLLMYVSFGMFGYLALRNSMRRPLAVTGTLVLAVMLSATLEIAQLFVPTRTCSVFDVVINIAGAALGVVVALCYGDRLVNLGALGTVARTAPGPLALLCCWVGYQLFPFVPELSRAHLVGRLLILAQPDSWAAPLAFVSFAEWLAVGALTDAFRPGGSRAFLALFLLLPARLLCADRTVTGAELAGGVAALLVLPQLRARGLTSARGVAWLLLLALIADGLVHVPSQDLANSLRGVPFDELFESNWQTGIVVLLRKTFAYGSAVWLFRRSGWRLASAAALTCLCLAGVAAAQDRGSSTPVDGAPVLSHSQAVAGLAPSTLYHYRARSRSAAGGLAVSRVFAFTTLPTGRTGTLIARLGFDEGTGTTTADLSGHGKTGTLAKGATWAAGTTGPGVALDGVDGYVGISHSPTLNAFPLSAAVWFKTTTAEGLAGIVNKYLPASNNGYQIFFSDGRLCAWYMANRSDRIDDGTECTLATPGYNDGQWHHVVFVVDGVSGRLFVDGAQKASRDWTGQAGAPSTTQDIRAGDYPGAVGGGHLAGSIDDLRIYDRALSSADVLQLYNATPSPNTTPQLLSAPAMEPSPSLPFSLSAALARAPGGFVEKATDTAVRPVWTASQIQAFLPQRGKFTFPAPYNTEGIRLTNASDCAGGADCVQYVGYSYWRNMNNHVGSDTILIVLSLLPDGGPTLFSYNKVTDQVVKVGPLFDGNNAHGWSSAEGWYFSATQPTKLYVSGKGPKLERVDVITKTQQTVFDITAHFGAGKYVWQTHSSNDDNVHSATVKSSAGTSLGCMAYKEDTQQYFYYPVTSEFDECQIDKSGRYLLIKDNVDGIPDTDNRFIDLQTGTERLLRDPDGAGGHSDNGYGYMIAADNWSRAPGAYRVWNFDGSTPQGLLAYRTTAWNMEIGHVSHANAVPGLPLNRQYACGGGAVTAVGPRANEIVCFRLDDTLDTLVVAQHMTDLNASGGGGPYQADPKGNLDVTGKYFIWTTNMGGNRLDAFIVKVPAQLLTEAAGNSTAPMAVTANNTTGRPVMSAVSATNVTSAGATIVWATDEPADSRVNYGLRTASLPGRTPDLADPLLVVLIAAILGLVERRATAGAIPATQTRQWWRT